MLNKLVLSIVLSSMLLSCNVVKNTGTENDTQTEVVIDDSVFTDDRINTDLVVDGSCEWSMVEQSRDIYDVQVFLLEEIKTVECISNVEALVDFGDGSAAQYFEAGFITHKWGGYETQYSVVINGVIVIKLQNYLQDPDTQTHTQCASYNHLYASEIENNNQSDRIVDIKLNPAIEGCLDPDDLTRTSKVDFADGSPNYIFPVTTLTHEFLENGEYEI